MDYKYIEQLLDRYFAAETTVEEEHILKAFFAQAEDNMPQELSQYRPLFEAMSDKEVLDDQFDEHILALVDEQPVVKARRVKLSERLRPLFSAAAIVAIVLTLSNAINKSFKTEEPAQATSDSYAEYVTPSNEPAMAYEQTAGAVQRTDSLQLDSLGVR